MMKSKPQRLVIEAFQYMQLVLESKMSDKYKQKVQEIEIFVDLEMEFVFNKMEQKVEKNKVYVMENNGDFVLCRERNCLQRTRK